MKIILTLEEDALNLEVEGDINYEEFVTAVLTVASEQTKKLFSAAKAQGMDEESVHALKAGVYDRLNYAFQQILDEILPPSEDFTENLTAEAILRAENELIEEAYNKLPKKDKDKEVKFPKAPIEIVEEEDA